MRRVIDAKSGRAGSLDYVCAWFLKAGAYLRNGMSRIGFVATNSITQGEQVAQLWPLLFDRFGLEIAFAHRTFEWMSDAKGKAHVHCVIIGLTRHDDEPKEKRLFSYDTIRGDPHASRHAALSPYLFDASGLSDRHGLVKECSRPLCDAPIARMGSKIVDGGIYIFDEASRAEFLAQEPEAERYLCPFIGSEEYINGGKRWILSLDGVSPATLRSMPRVMERVAAVRKFRLGSKKANTRELAETPTRFEVMTIPTVDYLAIPEVSSERREYVPIGWLKPPTIPSNLVHTVPDATLSDFALITSWCTWRGCATSADGLRTITGIPSVSSTTRSPGRNSMTLPKQNSKSLRKPCSTHARHMRARLSPTSTIPMSCRRILYEKLTAPMLAAAAKPKRGRKK